MASYTKSSGAKNSFANALRSRADQVRGENGAWKKGDSSVAPHIKAMNDCIRSAGAPSESELENARTRYREVLRWAKSNGDPIWARHAVAMIMSKREPRGEGEGEKDISMEWFFEFHNEYPSTAKALVTENLFGLFGCYQDYNKMLEKISKLQKSDPSRRENLTQLADSIRSTLLNQRTEDLRKLDKFLKDTATIQSKTHWARQGIRGFENIRGEGNESRVWKLRAYLDEVCAFTESADVEQGKVVKTYPYLDRVQAALHRRVNFPELSWVGKWIGSENAHFDKSTQIMQVAANGRTVYDRYLNYMIRGGLKGRGRDGRPCAFPVDAEIPSGAKSQFRKRNSALRTALKVTEVYMTAQRYAEILYQHVCARCLTVNAKAFLNELRKKAPLGSEESTGNRHPRNQDRIDSRAHLREFFKGKGAEKMNTAGLLPHDLMWKSSKTTSTAEKDLYDALVESMVLKSRKALEAKRQELAERAATDGSGVDPQKILASGNFLFMSDTSGSMTCPGTSPNRPWDISVGMGAFGAMLPEKDSPWHGLCMTFDSDPQIFDISGMKPGDALNKIQHTSRGMTTDLGKAMMTLIDHMVAHNVPDGEEPTLVVLSDGEFNDRWLNSAGPCWSTTYEKIGKYAAKKGRARIPTICWWNLKSERAGVQNGDSEPGTIMLQGRDPSAFKFLLEGEAMPDTTKTVMVDGRKVDMKVSSVTPMDVFIKQMTSKVWAPIDSVLIKSQEGIFAGYNGLPGVEE